MDLFGAEFTYKHVLIVFFIVAFLWFIGFLDLGKKAPAHADQDAHRATLKGLPGKIADSIGYGARLVLDVSPSTQEISASQAETDVGVVEQGNQAILLAMQQAPDEAPKMFDQNAIFARNLAAKIRKQLNKKDIPVEIKNSFLNIEKRLAVQLIYMRNILEQDQNGVLAGAQQKDLVKVIVREISPKPVIGGGKVREIVNDGNNETTTLRFDGVLPLAGPLRSARSDKIAVYKDVGVFDYYDDEDVKLGLIHSITIDASGEKIVAITLAERYDVVNTKLDVGNVVYWSKD